MGLAHKTLSAQSLINFPFHGLTQKNTLMGGSCVLEMAEPETEGALAPLSPHLWENYPDQGTPALSCCANKK